MIDKLKVIQYTLRDTEKYLFGIIKNEWMKDHPHFAYIQKQVLQDIIDVNTGLPKENGKISLKWRTRALDPDNNEISGCLLKLLISDDP